MRKKRILFLCQFKLFINCSGSGEYYEYFGEGGGGSGKEFLKVGYIGSSKTAVRGDFHTDKQKNPGGGVRV